MRSHTKPFRSNHILTHTCVVSQHERRGPVACFGFVRDGGHGFCVLKCVRVCFSSTHIVCLCTLSQQAGAVSFFPAGASWHMIPVFGGGTDEHCSPHCLTPVQCFLSLSLLTKKKKNGSSICYIKYTEI